MASFFLYEGIWYELQFAAENAVIEFLKWHFYSNQVLRQASIAMKSKKKPGGNTCCYDQSP